MKDEITLRELQAYIRNKDHHPDHKQGYFQKLIEEVGELSEMIRKNKRMGKKSEIKGTLEEELYDVLYYVAALANVHEIDLETCCHLKEEVNEQKYG
ncbi:MAG TPA: MazG nucleotide pyrophosphohydrolase domain-containing protein [Bacillales bacterium]|nr:MazG nucleotide pyrophosphohydrolase domain-containing protein [Bacillales bacterium]